MTHNSAQKNKGGFRPPVIILLFALGRIVLPVLELHQRTLQRFGHGQADTARVFQYGKPLVGDVEHTYGAFFSSPLKPITLLSVFDTAA